MREIISDYGEAFLYLVTGLLFTGFFAVVLNAITQA